MPGCIGCSSHLKTPGTVHRQYVQEAFLWLGQDLEHIVIRNFAICRDAEVVLDRKKRAGLYMVVRPTLSLWTGPNKRLPRDVGINIL